MSTNIYVLRLEGGKYYVGKTNDVMKRYQEHLNGKGSAWTKKYKPVSVVKTIKNVSPFEEDKITKEYMGKYGIENVRGGSYVSVNLDEIQEYTVKREIWAATDACTNCGRKGHFEKTCYAKTDVDGNALEEESDEESGEEGEDEDESDEEESNGEDIWECSYCKEFFDGEYYCLEHEKKCRSKSKNTSVTCYNCGKRGHYATTCYA
jgi:cellular nucleic acid-binding protein